MTSHKPEPGQSAAEQETSVTDGDLSASERTTDRPSGGEDETVIIGEPSLGPAGIPEKRYELEATLGIGGMGEVYRVSDRPLHRTVAMKVISAEMARNAGLTARFVEEAQATAQLQHPGIVPVHELGTLPDGRPFFTMREVKGRSLRSILDKDALPLRRLVAILHGVLETVAYAHSRGVVHRDLKPDNVLVGEFGEVLVVDWGLAKVLGGLELPLEPVTSSRSEDGSLVTRVGMVAGTPRYMAPEQASGDIQAIGPATDVFALGCLLAELLTGDARCAAGASCPAPELMAVSDRARSEAPADRFPDAGVFAHAIGDWLDGASRREEAMELVGRAAQHGDQAVSLRDEADRLRAEAETLLEAMSPRAPVERKLPAWQLQDQADEADRAAALAEVEQLQLLRAALVRAPDLPEAREGLARHYQQRHAAAEVRRDHAEAARYEALLRATDPGIFDGYLDGRGAVTVHTAPTGARVSVYRFERRDRRLVPIPFTTLGLTPVEAAPLDRGSYLLELALPDRPVVRYPVFLDRTEHWDGVPPGATAPMPIPLPRALGPDEDLVPGGWAWIGGDPEAIGALPRQRVWVDGFVIRRFPVTRGAFATWLEQLLATDPERARARMPHDTELDRAQFVIEGDRVRPAPPHGPDHPVAWTTWWEAKEFAAWEAARTGLPWRLPFDLEWEKAARGVDGRFFPWGDFLDPTFACFQGSHEGMPALPVVHAFPVDCGPYGTRGLGGTVRDWVAGTYERYQAPIEGGRYVRRDSDADQAPRIQRGGLFSMHHRIVRSATRWWQAPDARYHGNGFRLARSLVPGDL